MDYKTDSTTATELAEEATAIHALLSAALRQWDVSPCDTKPQECAYQLVNAVTGILILAKQHDQHMENAFQL